ncbi:Crp/Fnr family transcriptional regulator [Litchfieldella xinjiangensis]|uniref:Crp/Fnr family transcriptional regulator n=1 Tax=Litchfieldella xinjiangensis TaxID=1166948 RepID=UPI000693A8B5|nr:Crp/Fnr family transcriptional regulator [Halomonas xinjiangensis]
MGQITSWITHHFSHYGPLSDEEKALLGELEQDPMTVTAGDIIWQENDRTGQFCTLLQGWAYAFRNLDDGNRQILKVYLPGDIIGLREFAFASRQAGVTMIEDGVLCRFTHQQLLRIFRHSTTLTAILYAISCRQQAMLSERLVYMAHRTAQQRLAHFLYEIYLRLERNGAVDEGHFRLPLSQEELADALGLSNVHVSRTFSTLRDEGLVYRERHRVHLPDPERLAEFAEFDDYYLSDSLPPIYLESASNWALSGDVLGQPKEAT